MEQLEIRIENQSYYIFPIVTMNSMISFHRFTTVSTDAKAQAVHLLELLINRELIKNDQAVVALNPDIIADDEIKKFIGFILANNVNIKECYEKCDEQDIYAKFCSALIMKYEIMGQHAQTALLSFSRAAKTITNSLVPIYQFRNQIAKSLTPLVKMLSQQQKLINNWSKNLASAIKISFEPFEDGTLVKQFRASFKRWGQYGWTMIDDAPIDFFMEAPQNQLEADQMALTFFKQANLQRLFSELRQLDCSNRQMEEAIRNFGTKAYYSCAVLLISVIEGKLINFQRKNKKELPQKAVGAGAVHIYAEHVESSDNANKKSYTYLYYCNIKAFLYTLFSNAGDFKKEPTTLNRNFIMHGMSRRKIRRKDCIKLFLALKNLIEFSKHFHYDI